MVVFLGRSLSRYNPIVAVMAMSCNREEVDQQLAKFTKGQQEDAKISLPASFATAQKWGPLLATPLPPGVPVRIWRMEEPDRVYPNAAIPGIKVSQIAPDWVLHFLIRVCEWLLKAEQEKAIQESCIPQLNQNLQDVGARYRVTKAERDIDTPAASSGARHAWQKGGYRDAKLQGYESKQIVTSVKLHGTSKGSILHKLPGTSPERSGTYVVSTSTLTTNLQFVVSLSTLVVAMR
jgi:hypothetical protein